MVNICWLSQSYPSFLLFGLHVRHQMEAQLPQLFNLYMKKYLLSAIATDFMPEVASKLMANLALIPVLQLITILLNPFTS